jgi:dihydroflavonol-4-reductase
MLTLYLYTVGAIYGDNADVYLMENQTLHEQYFNDSSTVSHNPYQYAKTKAEREAWKMVESQGRWQLVVICPGLVLGPSFTSVSDSGSLVVIDQLLGGQMLLGVPDLAFVIVDVRDVAAAHIRAAEVPQANGRYIISNSQMTTYLDMSRCLKGVHEKSWILPGWQMPDLLFRIFAPFAGLSQRWINLNLGIRFAVNNERSVQELAMKYRPVRETLTDHYHSWVSQQKEIREHGYNVVKALA